MSNEKIKTTLRLLDEAGEMIQADSYWLTRDEQDMFGRLLDEFKAKLLKAYAGRGIANV